MQSILGLQATRKTGDGENRALSPQRQLSLYNSRTFKHPHAGQIPRNQRDTVMVAAKGA